MPRRKQVEIENEVEAVEATETEATETEATETSAVDERERRNGITRPGEDTVIGQIWKIADEITEEKGRPAFRDEVVTRFKEEIANANQTTGHTQYARWQKFNDYGEALREAKAEVKAEKEQAKAEAKAKAKEERAQAKAERQAAKNQPQPVESEGDGQVEDEPETDLDDGFVGRRVA